jgi:hypothetical protein
MLCNVMRARDVLLGRRRGYVCESCGQGRHSGGCRSCRSERFWKQAQRRHAAGGLRVLLVHVRVCKGPTPVNRNRFRVDDGAVL